MKALEVSGRIVVVSMAIPLLILLKSSVGSNKVDASKILLITSDSATDTMKELYIFE